MLELLSESSVTFFGDLHLGDGSRSDLFHGKDELLVDELRACPERCDAVVFMGDAVDLPQALRVRRVAAAHGGVFEAIEQLSREVRVIFVRGNHDWRVDYAELFPGSATTERLEVGDALVSHGHDLHGPFDVGTKRYFAAVATHSLIERVARFDFRVPLRDHDSWQNRGMHWLSYHAARGMRKADSGEDFFRHWSRAVWGDLGASFEPVSQLLRTGPHRAVVCGHTHLPGVVDFGDRTYVNAGSWTFDDACIAFWDGATFKVVDARNGRVITDDHYRWMIEGLDPGDYFDWWDHHYRGRLRFEWPETPWGRL